MAMDAGMLLSRMRLMTIRFRMKSEKRTRWGVGAPDAEGGTASVSGLSMAWRMKTKV